MVIQFDHEHLTCSVDVGNTVNIKGEIKNPGRFTVVEVKAAAPIDRMASYTGSGLPFPCVQIAFESTPNLHRVGLPRGEFECAFVYPNSFYGPDARTKIGPAIFILLVSSDRHTEPVTVRIDLPDPLPLKTLTYRPERSPDMYARRADRMGVRGQEEILRMIGDAKVKYPTA